MKNEFMRPVRREWSAFAVRVFALYMLCSVFLVLNTKNLWAHENEVDALEFKLLTEPKTVVELQQARALINQYRVAVQACAIQVREHLLPISCYQAIRIEKQLVLSPQLGINLKQYEKMCIQVASLTRERESSGLEILPPECAKLAASRIAMNKYKDGHDY